MTFLPGAVAPTLESIDAELARWRERLAVCSRNVAELDELPEYALARQAAKGAGRLAEEARGLVATMDELWQGVLLLNGALGRAEAARKGGSRLWRGEEAAAAAAAILEGPSIGVDLVETPVLHRSLLTGATERAMVSPAGLLTTMQAGFDAARVRLTRISEARGWADGLEGRLAALASGLPGGWAERVAGCARADALERIEALETLRPGLEGAVRVQGEVSAAARALAAAREAVAAAEGAAGACRAVVAGVLPGSGAGELGELEAWLGRIGAIFAAGRVEACRIGLANWAALEQRVVGQARALREAAEAGVARREELRARLGLLRAKRRVVGGAGLDGVETAAMAAVGAVPCDLEVAAGALRAFQAALVGTGFRG